MLDMHIAMTSLYPLATLNDVANFFIAAATFPAGLIDRARRVFERVPTALPGGQQLISNLLARLGGSEETAAQQLVAKLPVTDGSVLVPSRDCCVACEAPLELTQHWTRPMQPTVYSSHGFLQGVHMFSKRCTRGECRAIHYLSCAVGVGNFGRIPNGKVLVYPDFAEHKWFQVSPETVWDTQLLRQFEAQLLHSHTGAETFINEYISVHGTSVPSSARQRLLHVFFGWQLVRWMHECCMPVPPMALSSVAGLDEELLCRTPAFAAAFARKWGANHSDHCRQPDSCTCWMLDGHMKCKRAVCANKFARVVVCGALGSAVLGCTRSPVRGSRFCAVCREAAAVGPDGLKGSMGTSSAKDMALCTECDEPGSASPPQDEPPATVSADDDVETRERNVYLVAELLDSRACTIKRAGEEHRLCARRSRKEYLVRWAGYCSEDDSWVCECNIGSAALADYKEQKRAAHAGKKAAAATTAASGDFNISKAERTELTAMCKTIKDAHGTKHHTTAGILALVSSCGLFLAAKELYGAESLTQVHLFLFEIFFVHGLKERPPTVFAYDDACHLKKFLLKRLATSRFARWLLREKMIQIVCDRFHFPNHTDAWCKANVNPALCTAPGFEKSNTEAAEQAFAWLARSKHLYRRMNESRFFFLIMRQLELRNRWLCSQ